MCLTITIKQSILDEATIKICIHVITCTKRVYTAVQGKGSTCGEFAADIGVNVKSEMLYGNNTWYYFTLLNQTQLTDSESHMSYVFISTCIIPCEIANKNNL